MLRLTLVHGATAGLLALSATSCTEAPIEEACPSYTLANPDPFADIPDHCVIFASSSLGDDVNPGSKAQPVKTLTRAVQLAGSGKRPPRVHACNELFSETVEVPAGTTVRGGFDCSREWALSENARLEGGRVRSR